MSASRLGKRLREGEQEGRPRLKTQKEEEEGGIGCKRGREEGEGDEEHHRMRPRLVSDGADDAPETAETSKESEPARLEEGKPTVSYDKAFKHRAMSSAKNGTPPDRELRCWLNIYRPPPVAVRPPGYVAGAAVRARVQARAEVRQTRVNRLLRLRKASEAARRVARLRGDYSTIIKKPLAIFNRRAQIQKLEEDCARKARVETLMRLRFGKHGKGGL
ncbi:hypothetical protein DFH09DRAFT_1326777 [Mycena vulgaris]|nr:hypothetical protein DFH09DRAFT_1326777 [Mycena vulgaris]